VTAGSISLTTFPIRATITRSASTFLGLGRLPTLDQMSFKSSETGMVLSSARRQNSKHSPLSHGSALPTLAAYGFSHKTPQTLRGLAGSQLGLAMQAHFPVNVVQHNQVRRSYDVSFWSGNETDNLVATEWC
jgi:hypothetical protein